MKICNPIRRTGLVLALSACAATAAFAKDSGFYLGASFGQAKYDVDENEFHAFPVVNSRSFEDTDWGYALSFGYRLNKYIGAEINLVDLGHLEYNETGFVTTNPAVGGIVGYEFGTQGLGLDIIGTLPLDKFELYAKVGGLRAETKGRARIANSFGTLPVPTGVGNRTVKKTTMSYGAGIGYNINESFFLKLDYTMTPKILEESDPFGIEMDVNFVSVGFQVRF